MAANEYVQFLNDHRITDGLLREFLYKNKFRAARMQVEHLIEQERLKMISMEDLRDTLLALEEEE